MGCLLGASKTRKSNWLADCCRYMQEERMGTHARDLFVVLPPVTQTSSSEVAAVENSSKLSSPSLLCIQTPARKTNIETRGSTIS